MEVCCLLVEIYSYSRISWPPVEACDHDEREPCTSHGPHQRHVSIALRARRAAMHHVVACLLHRAARGAAMKQV